MDIAKTIRDEIEARKQDKQYQALQRTYVKCQMKVLPGGKNEKNEKADSKG